MLLRELALENRPVGFRGAMGGNALGMFVALF